jgi:hypothetical protein
MNSIGSSGTLVDEPIRRLRGSQTVVVDLLVLDGRLERLARRRLG